MMPNPARATLRSAAPRQDHCNDGADGGVDMDKRSDEELLTLLAGDPDALAAFYRRHVDKVIGFAARRAHDGGEVADLVAVIFLAVIESAHRFDARRGSAVPWLFGVAAKQMSAQRRQRARDQRLAQRVSGRRLLDDDDYERLEERLDAAVASRRAYDAMHSLGEAERVVFELVALEGLSPTEAARGLGISPASARMRLSRARRKLRRRLAADEPVRNDEARHRSTATEAPA
jgi:RNA polymerase sigma factor (sigma-70 family)